MDNTDVNEENFEYCLQKYQDALIEQGLKIVDKNPHRALELYYEANELYDQVGSITGDSIDLSVAIVLSMANIDMQYAIKLIEIIDIEVYRFETIEKLTLIKERKI